MKSITCLIIACTGFLSVGAALPLISPAHTQLAFSSKRSVEEGHPGKVSALRRRGTATSPANGEYPLGKRNKILARALPDDVKQYGEALLFWRKLNRCLRQKVRLKSLSPHILGLSSSLAMAMLKFLTGS